MTSNYSRPNMSYKIFLASILASLLAACSSDDQATTSLESTLMTPDTAIYAGIDLGSTVTEVSYKTASQCDKTNKQRTWRVYLSNR